MTEFLLRLPSRKPAVALLAKLDRAAQDEFLSELLHTLWDSYEDEGLPPRVSQLLRGWLAHAHFETSPVVQERIAEVKRLASSP